MNKDTYLSIDLDLFNCTDHSVAVDELNHILTAIKTLGISYYIVQDHSKLLSHIKRFPRMKHIWNLDHHSDLKDLIEKEVAKRTTLKGFCGVDGGLGKSFRLNINNLGCGSWLNFVPQRRNATLTWITNDADDLGWSYYNPFKEKITSWKSTKIEMYDSETIKNIDFDRVCGVGFSLSYVYLERHVFDLIRMLHNFSGQRFPDYGRTVFSPHSDGIETALNLETMNKLKEMYVDNIFKGRFTPKLQELFLY